MTQITLPYNKDKKGRMSLHDVAMRNIVRRVYAQEYLKGWLERLIGRPHHPLDLDLTRAWFGLEGEFVHGVMAVDLERVVGVSGSCRSFSLTYKPLVPMHQVPGWEKFALAFLHDAQPPLLSLYQFGEPFYVLKRSEQIIVSVLRAFAVETVMAYVVGPDKAMIPTPTIDKVIEWDREVRRATR